MVLYWSQTGNSGAMARCHGSKYRPKKNSLNSYLKRFIFSVNSTVHSGSWRQAWGQTNRQTGSCHWCIIVAEWGTSWWARHKNGAQNSTRYVVCFRFLFVKPVAVFFIHVGLFNKQGHRNSEHTRTRTYAWRIQTHIQTHCAQRDRHTYTEARLRYSSIVRITAALSRLNTC